MTASIQILLFSKKLHMQKKPAQNN